MIINPQGKKLMEIIKLIIKAIEECEKPKRKKPK